MIGVTVPRKGAGRLFAFDLLECGTAAVIQTVVVPHVAGGLPYLPDLLFLALAHKALTRGTGTVMALAVLFGAYADAMHSGYLFGNHIIVKLSVLTALNVVGRSIPRGKGSLPVLLALTAGIMLHNLLLASLLALRGAGPFYSFGIAALASACLTVIAAIIILFPYSVVSGSARGRIGS